MNNKIRQERLINKVIILFKEEYEKSLNDNDIYKPLSNALYKTWRHFNAIEQPRPLNTDKDNENEI